MLKIYDIDIYGRANTILCSIRENYLYHEVVIASSKKEATQIALNDFYMFIDDVWKHVITRRDLKIECECVFRIDDNKETLYINDILR